MTTIHHRRNRYTVTRSDEYYVITQYTPAGRKTRLRTNYLRLVHGLTRPENAGHRAEALRLVSLMMRGLNEKVKERRYIVRKFGVST